MFLPPIQMWGNLKDNGLKDAAENKHQKTTLLKLQQSFKKKREENKTKNLQKPKLIWKQNAVGAAPQTWGPLCSFWPFSPGCLTADSAKQWSTMWRWNESFRTDGRGQVIVSAPSQDGNRCFPLTDWVLSEGVKDGSHKMCSKSTVWGGDAPVKWEDKMWFPYEFIWA